MAPGGICGFTGPGIGGGWKVATGGCEGADCWSVSVCVASDGTVEVFGALAIAVASSTCCWRKRSSSRRPSGVVVISYSSSSSTSEFCTTDSDLGVAHLGSDGCLVGVTIDGGLVRSSAEGCVDTAEGLGLEAVDDDVSGSYKN